MDYKKIAEQLRKDAGYCTLESCKECAGNGKCPTQNMLYYRRGKLHENKFALLREES